MRLTDLKDWVIHLRLSFQFMLSPIFLLGVVAAGGGIDGGTVIAYLAFHLFGYAGGTALNSYYDRDEGPIGGLLVPPPVSPGLLPFALIWQLIGLVLALAVNLTLAMIYLIMAAMSIAYSHPRIRWKANPVASLATVALGQGVLAFLGGWTTIRNEAFSALSIDGILGVLAATCITLGFYPLTGIYQIEEDHRRGDQTLPVWIGPARSFHFALFLLSVGGGAAITFVLVRFRVIEAIVLAVFLVGLIAMVWRWSRSFQSSEVVQNYHTTMRLYAITSLAFLAWLGLHLLGVL